MEIERLFVNTLDDLEYRASSTDEYEVLGASALLRKLLLDESPLLHQVNRRHRLKIEFEIVDVDVIREKLQVIGAIGTGPDDFFGFFDMLDPGVVPNAPRKRVKLDAFLGTVVHMLGGEPLTVRDFILHEANIQGGIHAGRPLGDKEQAVAAYDERVSVGGHPPGLRQLRSIGQIVLRALKPIRDAVEGI